MAFEMSFNHTSSSSDISFDNLYFATIKCCVVIFSGYIAGRIGLITTGQASGIGTFVSKFALPALLFINMCELNFSNVNWWFLLSIFIAKFSIFLLAIIATALVKRPINWGTAAIFAIFCTQSNDFGYGYPIMRALYEQSHPDYVRYLYLIAPITVVILNPIGFTLMEYSNANQADRPAKIAFRVVKGVVLNPIVTMTIVGLIGNFAFGHKAPRILHCILDDLGNAFIGCALFFLGLSLVGKIKSQVGMSLITPALLITAKLLVTPLVARQLTMLLSHDLSANESQSISMYAFFYGTIPTAPTVFLYASMYDCAVDVVASGMVICTFIAAPFMLVSAKMMTLHVSTQNDYLQLLETVSYDVAIAAIVFCVWVIGVFILAGRWRKLPHRFTLCLVLAQLMTSIGVIIYQNLADSGTWQHTCLFVVVTVGVYSTRCCAGVIGVATYLLRRRGREFAERHAWWLLFYAFGLPTVVTGILVGTGHHQLVDTDPAFYYGRSQTITSGLVALINLVVVITTLIMLYRYESHHGHEGATEINHSATINERRSGAAAVAESDEYSFTMADGKRNFDADGERNVDINDRGNVCADGVESQPLIKRFSESYEDVSINDPLTEIRHDPQTARHVVLLVLISISMIVAVFFCLWRLVTQKTSGIYVEIEFLDTVLLYGQSFFVFTVFGLESQLIIVPFIRRCRRWFYQTEIVPIMTEDDLPPWLKQTRDQFKSYHMTSCRNSIVKQHRYMGRLYRDVFVGSDMVTWLVNAGVVSDRVEAITYGRRLLVAGVIQHVKNEHHFHDIYLFYRFLEEDTLSDD